MKNLKRLTFVGLIAGLLVMTSCMKDQLNVNPGGGSATEKEVLISFSEPGAFASTMTRALPASVNENAILKATVMVFDASGEFEYSKTMNSSSISGTGALKNITVSLKLDNAYHGVMVLTNLPAALTDDAIKTEMTGFKMADVYKRLHNAAMSLSKEWEGTEFIMSGIIPSIQLTPTTTKIETVKLVRSLAKVDVGGKWNSTLDLWDGLEKFKIEEIYIYNVNGDYTVSPKDAAYTNTSYDKVKLPTVYNFTSNTDGATSIISPIKYDAANVGASWSNKGLASKIFVAETANGTLDIDKRPCVIVYGEYEDQHGVKENYYYRMDFASVKADGTLDTYLDVLRNFRYRFNITAVQGPGYKDIGDALKSAPVNIKTEIMVWSEGAVEDVASDGIYNMGVSQKVYSLSKEQSLNNALSIYTTYTLTDLVVKYSTSATNADAGCTWITQAGLSNDGGTNLRSYDLKFDVSQNDAPYAREGYIHLMSGRMHIVVKVEQSDATASRLVSIVNDIQQDGLEFAAADGVDPGEKKFKIQWSPRSETLFASLAPVANPAGGNYDAPIWNYYNTLTGSGVLDVNGTAVYVNPVADPTGEVEFTIKPQPITDGVDGVNLATSPFYERQIQINYRATGAMGMMRKSFTIQQYVYNMVPKFDDYYLANGSQYSFKVQSNRQWKAYLIDNGGGMVEKAGESNNIDVSTPGSGILIGQGGYNVESGGTKVYFKTFNDLANPTLILGTAKVRIEWLKNGDDPTIAANWDKTTVVALQCGSRVELGSNCYMVKPTRDPILIPTRQVAVAMGLNDKPTEQNPTDGYLGMGWITTADYANLKVDVLWSDIAGASYTNTSVVKALSYDGKHVAAGTITVTPGTGVGNAVICLYVDNNGNGKYDEGDVIKWTWHIWNAGGYYPYDGSGNPLGTGTNNAWMDRNLGAINAIFGNVGAKGLFYQWGRKDPYIGSTTTTGTAIKPRYNAAGGVINEAIWSTENSLMYSVLYPLTPQTNWSGSISVATSTNDSWGNANGVKNAKKVFDPCPDGYRVPTVSGETSPWNDMTVQSFADGTGVTWATRGGYYPAAGLSDKGGVINVGTDGYYWSAKGGLTYSFSKTKIGLNHSLLRSYGLSVRCVQ